MMLLPIKIFIRLKMHDLYLCSQTISEYYLRKTLFYAVGSRYLHLQNKCFGTIHMLIISGQRENDFERMVYLPSPKRILNSSTTVLN